MFATLGWDRAKVLRAAERDQHRGYADHHVCPEEVERTGGNSNRAEESFRGPVEAENCRKEHGLIDCIYIIKEASA